MKYGLIGEKLGHSFSKEIHESLGYDYELREIARDELDGFMRERDFLGINVTIPYKETVIPYLDFIDDDAKEIGAVNTIVNRGGKLYGYNTDFYGLKMLLANAGIDVKGKKAAILGTGGTSKTAKAVLSSLGACEIIKVSRSARKDAISYEDLICSHPDVEIIVNTTPVGMYPDVENMPLDLYSIEKLSGVIDVVYNPLRTALVQSAAFCAAPAEGGLYMLVGQAVRASEIFLDIKYPEETIDRIYERTRAKKENIVLIGMPASGKSTVGRIIADRLGRKFVDTDEVITDRIKMPIKDFFAKEGEEAFREIERQVINELACESSLVIATGGGAVINELNQRDLSYNGRLYFIDRPLDKLMPTESRPLSSDRDAMKKRYAERYLIYLSVCDEKIDADCEAIAVAEKILENYR